LVPLSLVVMALIALASFRTIRGVVIPLLTVLISLVVTLAFTALFIGSLNIVTVAAPPILIVVGFAYAIHVVAAYYDILWNQHGVERTRRQTVFLALRKVALAVIFTGVTTAVGFFSLTTSSLGAIRQFGVFCGVGVIVTMIVSLTFGPALMQILPALAERDLPPFAAGIAELQRVVGDHFAPAQGGRFTSGAVADALAWAEQRGFAGVGQSSWGPTGFVLVDSEEAAQALVAAARGRFGELSPLRWRIVKGCNCGSEITTGPLVESLRSAR